MNRPVIKLVGLVLACAAVLTACSEDSRTPTPMGINGLQFVTTGVVDTGEFEICKYGTAASFEYSVAGGAVQQVSLGDGACAVLSSTELLGPGTFAVTVTELSDPAIVLDSIVPTINTIRDPAGVRGAPITGTSTYAGSFNGDRGTLVEFYNSPAPPPPLGCTFTLGYWKNHTDAWPAGFSPDDPFFSSGQTWLEVLQSPVKGNVYYIVAHQYIAAALNIANGASVPANVQTAFNDAAAYLADPAGSTLTRDQLTAIAGVLDSYNNGFEGVPHCPS